MNKQARGGKRKASETGFERWGGYMSAKISKLQNQCKDEAETIQKGIFNGVAIFVNGYTNPTGEELKRIMLNNGGMYHHYYSRNKTTHIIASNLPNSKIQSLNTDFIVSPKWITDSLEAKRLLDYKIYLLYTGQTKNQPKIRFHKVSQDLECEMSPCDTLLREVSTGSTLLPEDNGNHKTDALPPIESTKMVPGISADEMSKSADTLYDSSKHSSLSTANPNFLSDFYSNSRLHHISTTGAMFKEYVKELQNKNDNFIGRDHLRNWIKSRGQENTNSSSDCWNRSRTIMHIDMDCFFVSVGLINRPELQNEPVAVTHATKNSQPKRDKKNFDQEVNHFKRRFVVETNEGESDSEEEKMGHTSMDAAAHAKSVTPTIDEKCSMAEIASCSYAARKRGVKNGMFLGVALKLCPELKTIPYDFEGYKRVSMDLYDIVASYTKNIEAVSCDEMYVDLEEMLVECNASPMDFASCIREQIQEKTKCPCSVGIAPNMLTARMATKRAKPNGQFLLENSQVLDYMESQMVSELPGVGRSLRGRLEEEGVKTCGDLRALSLTRLQSCFGHRTGKTLFEFCRGIDDRPINKDHKRKSVSAEVNYGIRFESWSNCEKFLLELSEEVKNRLSKISMKGRTITLKLKVRSKDAPVETAKFMGHGICDNVAKSVTLPDATFCTDRIYRESIALLKQISVQPKDLRGVGIQLSKLEPSSSSSLSIRNYFSSVKPPSSDQPKKDSEEKKVLPPIVDINDDSDSSDIQFEDISLVKEEKEQNSCSMEVISGKKAKAILDSNGQNSLGIKNAGQKSLRNSLENQSLTTSYVIDKTNSKSPLKNVSQSPLKISSEIAMKNSNKNLMEGNCGDPSRRLDIEVLNALPPELREQVVAEYTAQGFCIPSPRSKIAASPQPGPSRLSSFQPESLAASQTRLADFQENASAPGLVRDQEEQFGAGLLAPTNQEQNRRRPDRVADMSFSEIDQSFLNALPDDIKEDLEKDFEKQKLINAQKHLSTLQPPSAIPSRLVKGKRGRPRGSVSRGGRGRKPLLQKQPNSVRESGRCQRVSDQLSPEKVKLLADVDRRDELFLAGDEETISPQSNDVTQSPNLCGEFELPSIKCLISQWITTCPSPVEVDVQILTEFCVNLIRYKDLEKLELILKFLNRKTHMSGSPQWRRSFNTILNDIQEVMLQTYKAPLLFKPFLHNSTIYDL